MKRVVIDTNILIGSAWSKGSASRRIVDACRDGRLALVVSAAVLREYDRMLRRAVRDRAELERLQEVIRGAEVVKTGLSPEVVEDPEDDKFFALAWAAGADAIITNDRRLLKIDGLEKVRVLRPSEFEAEFR